MHEDEILVGARVKELRKKLGLSTKNPNLHSGVDKAYN